MIKKKKKKKVFCYFENIQKVWFTGEASPAEE